jgi:hypothetical protein
MLRNKLVSAKWAPNFIANIAISIVSSPLKNETEATDQDRPIKFKVNICKMQLKYEHSRVCQNRKPIFWDLFELQSPDGARTALDQTPMGPDTCHCRE